MRYPLKIGLGTVAAYAGYVGYVQIRTSYEINRREARFRPPGQAEQVFKSLEVAGKFVNPFPQYRNQTLFEFAYRRVQELLHVGPRGGVPYNIEELRAALPTRRPDFELLNELVKPVGSLARLLHPASDIPSSSSRMTLTWIGQSCAFIQVPGLNILTDPCFGTHLVHETFGPKRITPPPCTVADLPPIDVVLVSHDHPDHLDLEAAQAIGNSARWIVPLEVGSHLKKIGINNITELDWWQKTATSTPEWEIVCTPAMHWSGRALIDSNSTLWCSFMLVKNGKPVFFHAGDTGYSPELFQGINSYFGGYGPKLAMLPCGAYVPSWHLRPQHTDPIEAVQIMKDLAAEKMVGVHWGTFVMSDEHYLEPRELLHQTAKKEERENDVIAPEFGKTLLFNLDGINKSTPPKAVRNGKALLIE